MKQAVRKAKIAELKAALAVADKAASNPEANDTLRRLAVDDVAKFTRQIAKLEGKK